MNLGKPMAGGARGRHAGAEQDVPPEHHHDLDFLVGSLDWEANVDAGFAAHRRFEPKPVRPIEEIAEVGYCEKWIAYSSGRYSAKELTVFPGRSGVIGVS